MKVLTLLILAPGLLAQEPESRPAREVTWSEHVAPLVFAHCTSCHRAGEAAPFALTTYEEAKRKGRMLAKVTGKRIMPPWHAEAGFGHFADERRLTDAQIQTLADWVACGMPEGDARRTPPLPRFPEGWQLGKPDVVLTMKDAYPVPAGGADIYRHFVLPLALEEDRWLSAIEVRPSARNVVHHILFFSDDTGHARELDGGDGKPGFRGMAFRRSGGNAGEGLGSLVGGVGGSLGGWAVGATPKHLPEDLAIPLAKGSDLVLQTHFHPAGKAEREQTSIGLYFKKQKPKRTLVPVQVPPFFGALAGLDLAAGVKDFVIRDAFTLPVAVEAISIGGHAHYLCTEMKATATLPDGKKEPLLWIRAWDFAWQDRYFYAAPVSLPSGTTIDVELHWDNSADNPKNPQLPPRRVRWGQQSTDEMGSITLAVVPHDEKDLPALQAALRAQVGRVRGQGPTAIARQMVERLRQLDTNGDGKITPDEIPARQRVLVLRADTNGNGTIEAEEIEALEKQLGIGK